MAKLTPAAFAAWCLRHLDLDTWLSESTLQRRLAGISGHAFTAAGLLAALGRAGWVEQHPRDADSYCLSSRCWLPNKNRPPVRTGAGLLQPHQTDLKTKVWNRI